MPISFPPFPTKNKLFTYNDETWQYNGSWWVKLEPDVNWAWNDGNGEGVFDVKTGTTLAFKSLVAGSGVSLSSNTEEILITSSGGVGSVFERRSDFVDPYLYCGFAISGSSESSNVWDITRITIYDSGGHYPNTLQMLLGLIDI